MKRVNLNKNMNGREIAYSYTDGYNLEYYMQYNHILPLFSLDAKMTFAFYSNQTFNHYIPLDVRSIAISNIAIMDNGNS